MPTKDHDKGIPSLQAHKGDKQAIQLREMQESINHMVRYAEVIKEYYRAEAKLVVFRVNELESAGLTRAEALLYVKDKGLV